MRKKKPTIDIEVFGMLPEHRTYFVQTYEQYLAQISAAFGVALPYDVSTASARALEEAFESRQQQRGPIMKRKNRDV